MTIREIINVLIDAEDMEKELTVEIKTDDLEIYKQKGYIWSQFVIKDIESTSIGMVATAEVEE